MIPRTVLLFLMGSAIASADIINLCFHTDGNSVYAFESSPEGKVVSAGSGGARYWNQFMDEGGVGLSFSNHSLKNGDGVRTGASLTVESGKAGEVHKLEDGDTHDSILYMGWYGLTGEEHFKIENLPMTFTNPGYQVIVYGNTNLSGRRMLYSVNGKKGTLTTDGKFTGNFIEKKNMLTFSDMKADKIQFKGNQGTVMRSAFCGIQIISNDHAELVAYKNSSAEAGKAILRWECGGDVKNIQIVGPKGGILLSTKSRMGEYQITEERAYACKLHVIRPSGETTKALVRKL